MKIEFMQTLFQNRTTGVVSELSQVCQLMLKSKSMHQLNYNLKSEFG